MRKRIRDFFSSLQYHMIFVKILAVLLVVVLCVSAIFYAFLDRWYQENHHRQQREDRVSIMQVLNEELETNLLSLSVQAQDFLNEPDTITLALAGVQRENMDSLDVTLNLAKFVQDNSWAEYACMLVMTDDSVLTSDKKITTRQDWEQSAIFDQDSDDSGLVWFQDQLYEILWFPEEKPLLELAVKIDRVAMLDDLRSEVPVSQEIYLYYQNNPVFGSMEDYPAEERLMVEEREPLEAGGYTGTSVSTGEEVIGYTSSDTNLQWVSFMTEESLGFGSGGLAGMLWPALIMVLVILILSSLILVWMVYRPMERMIRSMLQSLGSDPLKGHHGNELELIEKLYAEMEDQRNSMKSMLSDVGDAVYERLLTALVHGESLEDDETMALLKETQGDYPAEGNFQAVLLHIYYGPNRVCSLNEQEMHRWAVRRMSLEFWKNTADIHVLPGRENTLILILRYREELSAAAIRKTQQSFAEQMEEEQKKLELKLESGSSRIYRGLGEINEACQEAEHSLQERLYYRRDEEQKEDSWKQYGKKAAEILQSELTQAGQYTEKIMLMLSEIRDDRDNAPRVYVQICDIILERLIQMNVEREDSWMELKRKLNEDQSPLKDGDPRCEWMHTFAGETLHAVEQASGKEKYRYIENARKYIEAHYNDNSLSLNVVSAYCGISSSYLSRLFTDFLPPGFVEYLNQYRVKQAESLLLGTSYTIAEIGFKTGFNSPQNFIRVFKKYRGETPGQFRSGKEARS